MTARTIATDELRRLAEKHQNLAHGFRLCGERNLAMAHQRVADRCKVAWCDIEAALVGVDTAKPVPLPPVKSTRASERPCS